MKILRLNNVKEKTGLSRSTIYSKIQNGEFPKQIKLGARMVGWIENEIEEWLLDKVKSTSSYDTYLAKHNEQQKD